MLEQVLQWYQTIPYWEKLPIEFLLKEEAAVIVKPLLQAVSSSIYAAYEQAFSAQEPAIFAKAVAEENKRDDIGKIAKNLILNSHVIPNIPETNARPEHLSQLFASFLRTSLTLSQQLKMDILLPGSFLGEKSIQVVSSRGPNIEITASGVEVIASRGANKENFLPLEIVPEISPLEYCNRFLRRVDGIRRDVGPDEYVTAFEHLNHDYAVQRLTAARISYASHRSQPGLISIGGFGSTAPLTQNAYAAGIRSMISFLPSFNSVGYLSQDEVIVLRSLANEIGAAISPESANEPARPTSMPDLTGGIATTKEASFLKRIFRRK